MSAQVPQEREAILEANVRALFERAFVPVPIRAGFAAEVARSAAAVLERRTSAHGRRSMLAVAAAASFLLAALAFAAWQRSDSARDSVLERAGVALREEGGPWVALEGSRITLGARALELAVLENESAGVACGSGAAALLGPAEATFTKSGAGARVELAHGGLALRAFHGRVRGAFGSFECAAADLDLACDASGRARAWLTAGRSRFESRTGRREDLVPGHLLDTHSDPARPEGAHVGSAPAGPMPGVREPVSPPATGVVAASSAERAPLSGNVTDGEGRAVARFRVLLLREVELPHTAEPQGTGFEDGRFAFAAVEAGSWTVFVHAEGFALATREHVRLGSGDVALDFVLERGASVTGRVVDASGQPLAGATLVSESDVPASLLAFELRECPDHPSALAKSDGDGRFRLDHLASRSTVLRATLAGFGATWSAPLLPGAAASEVRIELSAGSVLAGRVEREDGAPWPGAVVIAMPQRTFVDLPRRSYGFALTDASGAYRIADLPEGAYVAVRIEPPEGRTQGNAAAPLARTEVREVALARGAVQPLDFLASPRGSRLAGRILRADREPLAATTVSIMPIDAASQRVDEASTAWRSQLTNSAGVFEFADVAPGSYEIYVGVRTPMDIVRVDRADVGPAVNVDREIRVPAGEIAGRVRASATGSGVHLATVVLERETDSESVFCAKVFTDDAGAWRVPYLEPGRYRVRVHPGHGLAGAGRDGVEARTADVSPLDFELETGARLALTVRDENGLPLAGVEARVIDERGVELELAWGERTGADGVLAIEGVPSGRSRLWLRGPGGATSEQVLVATAGESLALEVRMRSTRAEPARK
ncbi:MAG TPA: carboxypeptidase-like regulatory domain-containing protein [Planctomycetota bacterium]|nr:carboxypeptidase-like regulatory domain-containing protein [Planctomycetota bacterium]